MYSEDSCTGRTGDGVAAGMDESGGQLSPSDLAVLALGSTGPDAALREGRDVEADPTPTPQPPICFRPPKRSLVGDVDLEARFQRLAALDLEPIASRIRRDFGWTETRLCKAERCYRQFLERILSHPQAAVIPTGEVDTFWHAHILDTRKYRADCHRIFGGYVDHVPNADISHLGQTS